MAEIEFEWDSRDIEIWRSRRTEKALQRAVRLAGNQAIRTAQKASINYIKRKKLVRSERAKKGMPIILPGSNAEIRQLLWVQKISGAPVPLSSFPHVQTKEGVRVRVNVGGGSKRIKSAFVATMRSGHVGIFRRRGKSRLPIDELWTTRLSDSMRDQGAIQGVQAKALQRLSRAFERGIRRELGKLRRRGVE